MADKTTKVKQVFDADARPLIRESRKAAKAQEDGAKRSVAAQEKVTKSLGDQVERLGRLALAAGAVVLAWKKGSEAADFYAKRTQLAAAASGADIKAIQGAARGLITETEALNFAAAALNTEFNLNQEEMEQVAKFMIVLRNQGNDLAVVQDKLTKAIVEGNSRALRKFGVIVHGSSGKLETQKKILEEVRKQNVLFGDSLELATDQFQRMAIAGTDAAEELKEAWGVAAIHIADSIRRMVRDGASDILEMSGAVEIAINEMETRRLARWRRLSPEEKEAIRKGRLALGGLANRAVGAFNARFGEGTRFNPLDFAPDKLPPGSGRGGGGRPGEPSFADEGGPFGFAPRDADLFEAETARAAAARRAAAAGAGGETGEDFARILEEQKALRDAAFAASAAGQALQELQGIGVSAFSALVTGSDNFGAAMQKAACKAAQGHAINLFGIGLSNMFMGNPAQGAAALAGAGVLLALSRALCPDEPGISLPGVGGGGGAGAVPTSGGGGGSGMTIEKHFVHTSGFGSDDGRRVRRERRDQQYRVNREASSRPSSYRG
jgi:hypothetical protein